MLNAHNLRTFASLTTNGGFYMRVFTVAYELHYTAYISLAKPKPLGENNGNYVSAVTNHVGATIDFWRDFFYKFFGCIYLVLYQSAYFLNMVKRSPDNTVTNIS